MMVEFGFYCLPAVMFFTPAFIINKSEEKKKWLIRYAMGFILWIIYLSTLSRIGILNSFDLPPRVPLLVVIPAIVLIIFITSGSYMRDVIKLSPRHFSIYIQSFRIVVELLIYGAFVKGVFPKAVTFEGTNFDILVGISALPIGYLVQRNKMGRTGVLIWNFIAMVVLTVTVATFIYTFYFSGTASGLDFVRMPYLLLASVLLPFAVFYHVVSIRQYW